MKRILITGEKSYIGRALKMRLKEFEKDYYVEMISLRNELWRKRDLSGYDSIVHTAALVHNKVMEKAEYEKINVKLTLELVNEAKKQGVNQFIFLSTMGIYAQSDTHIQHDTMPRPSTLYAKSKLKAEQLIEKEETSNFNIAIIRPPLVYGPGSPGNYQKLSTVSKIMPVFPKVKNKRSMIYIDNLSEFIRLVIDSNQNGVLFPQNKEYVNTSYLYKKISQSHNKKSFVLPGFGLPLKVLCRYIDVFQKVFGDFTYSQYLPGGHLNKENINLLGYNIVDVKDSIRITEGDLYERKK